MGLYWRIIISINIMTVLRTLSLAAAAGLLLLAGCGANDDGVKLGEFPAMNVAEGDTIELKAPSSKSPAPFYFSSSDPAVALVEGTKLTGKAGGTATITAGQGRMGSYNPTSTTTTVTVVGYVSHGGLTWMPVTAETVTASDAKAHCAISIRGTTGWRLPSQAELAALAASSVLAGKGWLLPETWTSDAGKTAKTQVAVNLTTKEVVSLAEDKKAAVTCVKE